MKRITIVRCSFIAALLFSNVSVAGLIINEFSPNQPGVDSAQQIIEFKRLAPYVSQPISLVAIETDSNSNLGVVDQVVNFDELTWQNELAELTLSDLENPSFMLLLLLGNPFAVGDDLDADNNGWFDAFDWVASVLDGVHVSDSRTDSQSNHYAEQTSTTSFGFTGAEPELLFRDQLSLDWYAVNRLNDTGFYTADGQLATFDLINHNPTYASFGSQNPYREIQSVPEPPGQSLLFTLLIFYLLRVKLSQTPTLDLVKWHRSLHLIDHR